MKKKILTLFAAAAVLAAPILVSSCGSKSKASANGDELEGRISLSGAFALYPLAVKWAEEFKKLHPNVSIEVDGGGAGKGIRHADYLCHGCGQQTGSHCFQSVGYLQDFRMPAGTGDAHGVPQETD